VKWVRVFLALLICLMTAGAAVAQENVMHYYFINACESCTPEADFADEFLRLTGQELSDQQVIFHNVFHTQGRAAYEEATAGWSEEARQLPLLIMNGQGYAGVTAIGSGLQARFGAREQDTRSLVYFLTAVSCSSCERARETVEQHPAIVAVEIDGRLVGSAVEVQEISVSAQPDMAMALFRQYGVPDAQRTAPMIPMGNTFLAGEKAITGQFLSLLRSGAALHTPQIEMEQVSEKAQAVSLWGAAMAGVTAGFNPCALSMLLMMAGILLSAKRSIAIHGALYLAGKLVVYLLIGFLFSQLWIRYAPAWLPLAAKVAVSAVSAVLIVLNVLDAIHARRGKYGQIRNQLPGSLRKGIRELVRSRLTGEGQWLGLGAWLLGMIVAAGEFMCAGQVYVAVLIANAQSGAMLPLAVYSLAFLAPSAVVLMVIQKSKKTMAASDWLLRRMPMIKLATALVMTVVLIYTWLAV